MRSGIVATLCLLLLGAATVAAAQEFERVRQPVPVSGIVFLDRDGDGARDPGEPGLPGVSVSDQAVVVVTGSDGRFSLDAAGYGLVFVIQPDAYLVRGPFWRRAEAGADLAFGLTAAPPTPAFRFVHASDTHLSEQSLPRMRRFRALVDSIRPAFVLISGDLVRDALRVGEAEARGYYEMLQRELAAFPVPVYTALGNHEIFGIERHHSLVSRDHPMYGKRMYRAFRGPNYHAFTYGGVHFIGLDTVDYDDLWYNGHVDSLQVAWLRQDLARLPAGTRVVTFNHIPMVTGAETLDGFRDDGAAPTAIRIRGRSYFRHVVRNAAEIVELIGDRLEIALGGHMHMREQLRYETAVRSMRFYQTAAVTGPVRGPGPLGIRSGITLYSVDRGRVDDGLFIPLDPD